MAAVTRPADVTGKASRYNFGTTEGEIDAKILGFSNLWYKPALDSAVVHKLEPDLHVRVVTAVYFCATKLEAFAGRGKNDTNRVMILKI